MKIGIDAGHGGKDPGAVGADGTKEKDIVLAIAEMVFNLADKRGHRAGMTRREDKFLTLRERYSLFNRAGVDVAISIHANASARGGARGCWVIYKGGAYDGEILAHRIADAILQQCPAICQPLYSNDASSKKTLLAVQKPPSVLTAINASGKRLSMIYGPKARRVVLIETGFITNEDDRELLKKASVQMGIAKAIVYGAEADAKARGIK